MAAQRRPGRGSRGGKYWINKKGNIEYGPPPSGVRARTPEQWQAHARTLAKQQLGGIKSADDLKKLDDSWEIGVSGPNSSESGGYNHFGSGKGGHDAAIASATKDAADHPDLTYVVTKIDGNYVVGAKATKDLMKDSPDKQGASKGPGHVRKTPANLA